jgi:hypothetical protein
MNPGSRLKIIRAKPNPSGKDTGGYGITKETQLLGEWVDVQNISGANVALTDVRLANSQFDSQCAVLKKAVIYWEGAAMPLGANQIARIHTGQSRYADQMLAADRNGVHLHLYAEKGWFVLNNRCGDRITIWWKKGKEEYECLDEASYHPNPPDGAILHRVGVWLLP